MLIKSLFCTELLTLTYLIAEGLLRRVLLFIQGLIINQSMLISFKVKNNKVSGLTFAGRLYRQPSHCVCRRSHVIKWASNWFTGLEATWTPMCQGLVISVVLKLSFQTSLA